MGVKDNPAGRAFARQKISQIEMDVIAGYFDPTLLKYKPRKLGSNPSEITAIELFRKYAQYRLNEYGLSHSSKIRFDGIASKLNQFLGDKPAHKVTESVAKNVIARWSEQASDRTIKERLCDLKACWDWGKGKYHLSDSNPWKDCRDRSRSRSNTQPKKRTKPFTIPEIQAIIVAFKNHPHFSHYADFVVFLAQTGCRFGEAAGLRWKHLNGDFSSAWITEAVSRGKRRNTTKTGKDRTVHLSSSLRLMLIARYERIKPKNDDLVFPSPKGLSIDDNNFSNRAWKAILAECNIEHRKIYTLRHSAISHALAAGVNSIDLSKQTGHNPRVLLNTYAHSLSDGCVFIDFCKEL